MDWQPSQKPHFISSCSIRIGPPCSYTGISGLVPEPEGMEDGPRKAARTLEHWDTRAKTVQKPSLRAPRSSDNPGHHSQARRGNSCRKRTPGEQGSHGRAGNTPSEVFYFTLYLLLLQMGMGGAC